LFIGERENEDRGAISRAISRIDRFSRCTLFTQNCYIVVTVAATNEILVRSIDQELSIVSSRIDFYLQISFPQRVLNASRGNTKVVRIAEFSRK